MNMDKVYILDQRVAVDVNVSNEQLGQLFRMGISSISLAGHGEKDIAFIFRSYNEGARIFLSRDSDIPRLIAKYQIPVLHFESVSDLKKYHKTFKSQILGVR